MREHTHMVRLFPGLKCAGEAHAGVVYELFPQAKEQFLEWMASEPGIEVCPDIDMFHAFTEASV